MNNYLLSLERTRSKLVELIDLYNAGQIVPFLAEHTDDVIFATPDEQGALVYGAGKLALKEDVLRYRDRRGRLTILDVFPLGSSVNLLMDDEAGHRTEFCLELGACGLLTSVYALHVAKAVAPHASSDLVGRTSGASAIFAAGAAARPKADRLR
jgi:hypothetical protein